MADTLVYTSPPPQVLNYSSPAQGPAGPQGGGVQSVATVAGLSSLPDATYGNGQLALVGTQKSWWVLDVTSSATIVANQVVATLSGVGRWIRQPWVHGSNSARTLWYIDPKNTTGLASDENSGLTAGTPLRSDRELLRRVSSWDGLDSTVDIFYLSDRNQTDPSLIISGTGTANGKIRIRGTKTVLKSGTLSNFTAAAPSAGGGGTFAHVTDSVGASWAAYTTGQFIRLTSGAHSGATAAIFSNDGAGVATVGDFYDDPALQFLYPSPITPAGNETYDVVRVTECWSGAFTFPAPTNWGDFSGGIINGIVIDSCSFQDPAVYTAFGNDDTAILAINCVRGVCNVKTEDSVWLNCLDAPGAFVWFLSGYAQHYGGGMLTGVNWEIDSAFTSIHGGGNFISQGPNLISIFGTLLVEGGVNLGVRSNSGLFIRCECEGSLAFGLSGSLFGSPAGRLFDVRAGGHVSYGTSFHLYARSGGASDFTMNGQTSVAVIRSDTGAFQAARTCTFANLAAAYGSGGFGGNIIDLTSGAKLVSEAFT